MSKASIFAVSLSVQGDGANQAWAPLTAIANAASPGGSTPVAVINGTVTVPVPAGAIGFVYAPPAASALQKTLKFNNADTGGPMAVAVPTPYDWEGATVPPANIYITATGAESGTLYWI